MTKKKAIPKKKVDKVPKQPDPVVVEEPAEASPPAVEEPKVEEPKVEDSSPPPPKEPKATVVNEAYDAMPDIVNDPAKTFRMALLDTQRIALENKRNFTELSHSVMLQNTQKKMAHELATLDAEIRTVKQAYADQKAEIEKTYHISLRSYNYNDETGVLTKQTPTGTEE